MPPVRRLRPAPVAVAAVLALNACTTSPTEAPASRPGPTSTATTAGPSTEGDVALETLVPALGELQGDQDRLPGAERTGPVDVGVDPASTRYLGETRRARYWVALTDEGAVCLVDAFGTREAEALGSTCTSPRAFADGGIQTRTTSSTTTATGYLVPRGFAVEDAGTDVDWAVVADNLLAPSDQL
ncbi:hypothetical protein WDV85_09555 [Pseudokineococcus sp. 5B2Z-1]|uniref:hypothetical protein n=1 Tax=Pseudokineococcus sp. 5B2Z-1 TaxID=3132744 RepID=UPI0030B1DD78